MRSASPTAMAMGAAAMAMVGPPGAPLPPPIGAATPGAVVPFVLIGCVRLPFRGGGSWAV